MLRNIKKNYQSGFTIIEVLIVLAIAGLIMVAVFTAVPALQRSARNSSQKGAASQIMASFSAYVANHNGTLPKNDTTVQTAAADFKSATGNIQVSKLFYLAGTGTAPAQGSINNKTAASAALINDDSGVFVSGAICDSTNGNTSFTTTGASARSYVLMYAIESGSGLQLECIGS